MESKPPGRRRIQTLFRRAESSASSLVAVQPPRASICELCQKLSLSFSKLRSGNHVFHGTPSQIAISAEAGCPLCGLLSENFDLGPISLPIRFYGIRRRLSLQEKESLVEEGDIEALRLLNGYDRDDTNPFSHKLALYTTHDDVSASSLKRRPFIKDFASEECFRLIKSWLDTCVFHHPGCNTSIISQLPTRVIDVGMQGGQQDPFLFTPPQGYKYSYVALSYCWGNTETRFVLTKENSLLPTYRLPLRTLPKTLKDAIEITRKLKFRFLWVDALCIIQEGDGGEDFLRQSVTMRHIYGNATLTIAAAAAKNVNEGIFRKPHHEQPECKVLYDLPDGTIGTAYLEFEENDRGASRVDEPLNTRAWAFQERILSPRVVVFYEDQLSWDCTSALIDSNGPLNPLLKQNRDSPGRYSDFVASQVPVDDAATSNQAIYMAYWRSLVEFYSRRALTKTSDKLNAIAGLAELIKLKTEDSSYIAGIWKSDLEAQLCWYTDKPFLKRPERYRAPTWSWASIDGPVRFWIGANFRLLPVEIQIPPEGNELGEIREAVLKIRGHLHSWDRPQIEQPNWTDQRKGLYFDDLSEKKDFYSKEGDTRYFSFYTGVPKISVPSSTLWIYAFILKAVGTRYRRVGIMVDDWMCQIRPKEWTDRSPVTICIE
ncbi:uncharacterized protein BP5553_02988 [Venustampulla echinocandica]|uniref:Heterokaryon incompatibility domain-containing protein n=1 Tax=Venustampulla echinocandica TaxID=2656787 RepID=A0A370TT25_9HELO|nr:uncharacterized protein BP5553_02988 [Venustampulla echinocandica]RDL38648.1 hypothetical protein BP5553_02988 [Venustampulla echinocandica]